MIHVDHPKDSTNELNHAQTFPLCPVCDGRLIEIRAKLVCARCHTICETCCDGGCQ